MPDAIPPPECPPVCPVEDRIESSLQRILEGQARHEEGQRRIETNVGAVTSAVAVLGSRLGAAEGRLTLVEEARRANSDRVKAVDVRSSSADLEHDAKIAAGLVAHAELVAKVDGIATTQAAQGVKVDGIASDQALQLAILQRFDAFMVVAEKIGRSPLFRVLLAIATVSALGWAASKGITVKIP